MQHRHLFRWLVPLLSIAGLVALGEAGFHLIPNSYRQLVPWTSTGEWHTPGKTYTYYGAILAPYQPADVAPNVVRWNRGGWHDLDHDVRKPPRTLRVLVLGDSYVEGVQVRLHELYHRQLERVLAQHSPGLHIEVIAMGASGWGQQHELDALRKDGLAYRPDVVIAEFLPGNDVRNNNAELERMVNEQVRQSSFARLLFIKSLNAGLFFCAAFFDHVDLAIRQWRGQQDPIDSDVYRQPPHERPDLWQAAWQSTDDLFVEMHGVSERAGAALVIVTFTSPMEIEAHRPDAKPGPNGMNMALPARTLERICAARALHCLNLEARFALLPDDARHAVHLAGDGHWSRDGHRRAAEETARFLIHESPIWMRAVRRAMAAAGA